MGKNHQLRGVSIFLAGLFTIVMVYATVVIPMKLHAQISSVITGEKITFLTSSGLLWRIGMVSLCLLVALVVAGFVLEKTRLSSLGSVLLYLPTFSYFALVMWWLYGIGFLRVLWLPIADILPFVGELVYLPYLVLIPLVRILSWLLGTDIGIIGIIAGYGSICFFIGGGSFVFLLGTEAWLYGKKKGQAVIDFGVYQYSRHPQYLGFILWSYGGSFRVGSVAPPPVLWGYIHPGFPWLVSVLLVMCIALFEEQTMVQEYGEEYLSYREETPFLLPLPSFLATLVTGPMRLLLGKDHPTKKREIAYVFFLYLSLYLLAAYLFHYLMLALLGSR
ncbi:MAG: DUF1295 domain-containing protein [Candidatus Korarchaeota archaeon]|nr:DUF1295 domain-containing protein [Candidatus Korarchaeota archaeon]NIU82829.1 DUF1295 domain-containing protein [Candidatus Thorarchaeota archaeon]NIW13315.1 DUF1295 domain-containing protein [Candidatus Thorarchaeota archaeon]NIW51421.1 DUF1295 domain-containing protein [Candidatus Korarchaeota archaeon]